MAERKFPDWATTDIDDIGNGDPNKADPGPAKQASGWVVEKPLLQTMNWLQNLFGHFVRANNEFALRATTYEAEAGEIVRADNTSADCTILLPDTPISGQWVTIAAEDISNIYTITIDGNGNDIFESGSSTLDLPSNDTILQIYWDDINSLWTPNYYGSRGLTGSLSNVRKSKLDNPICHLFTTNKIAKVLARGSYVEVERDGDALFVDRYNVVRNTDDSEPFQSGSDTPREEDAGWLMEEAGENLILHSRDFSNAAWIKTAVTVTPNAVTAPDGTLTADELESTGADGFVRQTIAVTANEDGTFAIWLRANSNTTLRIIIQDVGVIDYTDDITVTTKWQRFNVSGNISSGSAQVFIGGNGTFTTGEIIYAWQGQGEESSFPTSDIFTDGSPVTRNADSHTVPSLGNLPDISKPFSITFKLTGALNNNGSTQYIWLIPINETASDSVSILFAIQSGGGLLFRYGDGTTNVSISFTPIKDVYDVACVYDGSRAYLYMDGVLVGDLDASGVNCTLKLDDSFYIGRRKLHLADNATVHIKDLRAYGFDLNIDETKFLAGE